MQFCNFMNQSTWKAAILVSFALAQQTLSPARRVIFQSYMLLLASVNHEYKAVITLRLRLSMAVSMAELEKCLKVSKNELLGALKLCLRVPHKTSEKVLRSLQSHELKWLMSVFFCSLSSQENQMMILAYFRVMYTIGYSLSLASLSLALVILLIFRWVTAFLHKDE